MTAVLPTSPTSPLIVELPPASRDGELSKPIGVLVIGRKRPGFDQEWNQQIRGRVATAMDEMSLSTVGADEPVIDDQTVIDAIARIKAAGCDALLVLQPSLGAGQLAFTVMQQWSGPIVLWATPERPDGEKVSSCSLVAQHLWASVMRQSKHPFEFVYGDPDDETTRGQLGRALKIAAVPAVLARTKVGLVGGNAPGFVAMHADPFALKKSLGVQLHNLSLAMFIERVRELDETRAKSDARRVRELGLAMDGVADADLATNSRYYLAMRDLIAEEKLDAITLQCWPEFGAILGQWPYLALTRLTAEGFITAMEGDVDGAITCLLGKLLGGGVGFITDWLEHDEKTIHFWHGGVAPLPLMEAAGSPGGPALGRHFNIQQPMVVDGRLKTDLPVTVARLWRCDDRYHMTAFHGRTIKPHRLLSGNAGVVRVDDDDEMDVRDWFDDALHAGMPHHVIVFAGRHGEAFRRLARVLKVSWFEKGSCKREV